MNYFIFYTAVYGLSWIITYSLIFQPLRHKLKEGSFLNKLTSCIVCTSYWVSTFFSLLYYLFDVLETNIIIYCILPYSAVAVTWITGNLIGEFDD